MRVSKVIGVLVCMRKGLKKLCLAVNFLILVNEHFQLLDLEMLPRMFSINGYLTKVKWSPKELGNRSHLLMVTIQIEIPFLVERVSEACLLKQGEASMI